MFIKALSNQDFCLIQSVCADQWQVQKCYGRLRAIEVLSHPSDLELFEKFVRELVSPGSMVLTAHAE